MKKIIIARIVLIVLILGWMNMIFGFSAATDVESQSLSDKITIKVVHIIKPDYDSLSEKEQLIIFGRTSFGVRKLGHLCEYTMLGVLTSLFLATFASIRESLRYRRRILLGAGLWVLVYAISDEIHQGFVHGRSPEVRDVLIDLVGGLIGALIVLVIVRLIKMKRTNND